jgi:hypothetical protein
MEVSQHGLRDPAYLYKLGTKLIFSPLRPLRYTCFDRNNNYLFRIAAWLSGSFQFTVHLKCFVDYICGLWNKLAKLKALSPQPYYRRRANQQLLYQRHYDRNIAGFQKLI